MTSFPKVYPLFYCPDIFLRDNKLLTEQTVILDTTECFSMIIGEVWYHTDYKIYFAKNKRNIIETVLNDANEMLRKETQLLDRDYTPLVEEDKDFDHLFYDIEMYLVHDHYELLRELQRIREDDDPDWACHRIEQIERILDEHRENYENKDYDEVSYSNGTIWSDLGYSASANADYRKMQKILFDAYDRNPIRYSPQSFWSYYDYLKKKNGSNRNQYNAHKRRYRDYTALKDYADTGERAYIANFF